MDYDNDLLTLRLRLAKELTPERQMDLLHRSEKRFTREEGQDLVDLCQRLRQALHRARHGVMPTAEEMAL